MNVKRSALCVAVVLVGVAQATAGIVIEYNDDGYAVGATGLELGDITYNVEFVPQSTFPVRTGSFNDVFGTGDVTLPYSISEAREAAVLLSDALTTTMVNSVADDLIVPFRVFTDTYDLYAAGHVDYIEPSNVYPVFNRPRDDSGVLPERAFAVLIHEPTCDFTGNNICNVTDLDLMQSLGPIATGIPATGNEQFDLNGDEVIDLIDRDEWLAVAATENGFGSPYKLGDANIDGVVDGSDFISWSTAKFTANLLWSKGNFNADAVVDGQDLLLWNDNKFTSSDEVTAVPEPTTGILSLLGLVFLGFVRRH